MALSPLTRFAPLARLARAPLVARAAAAARPVTRVLRPALSHALDFCYPGVCAVCEASAAGGAVLCGECATKLAGLAAAGACGRCAMPLSIDGAPCPWCLGRGVAPFERMVRLAIFDDPLKHLVHLAKYHRRWPLLELLADRLVETERAKALLSETDVLVPVPLHPWRHVLRGYNQADVVARRIGGLCHIAVVNAVRRVRDTETQTHLSQEERAANVKGAFALKRRAPRRLFAKHVVIVDDVMTTGATLREVARVIKRIAPASLSVLTLAIADRKGRGFAAK